MRKLKAKISTDESIIMIFYKEKFKSRRLHLRYSSSELAKQCGVTKATINRWERGVNCPPEAHVRILANILAVSVADISDLPDNTHNNFLSGIEDFNKLANINEQKLKEEEEDFIRRIKQQRQQIKKANIVINSLLNTMHSAFYIKSATNEYLLANSVFLKLVQLSEYLNVDGKTDRDFFPNIEAEQNSKTDQSVLELRSHFINKQMHIPGTRKKRWGLITKVPIMNNEGIAEGMLCTIKDITEEKKANELNMELRSAISKIQDVVWTGTVIDYKFKYTTVNQATQSLLGLTCEQFFKDAWKKNVHPDFLENMDEYLKDTKNNTKQIEYKYIHPHTRETRWLQNRINIDGHYYFGIIRDITEKHLQEIEQEYLFKCLNSMDSMFWVAEHVAKTKSKFKYLTISKGIEKIFGGTKAELEKDRTIWGKRFDAENIHSKGKTSFEVDYLISKDNQVNDSWIHEVIHVKDNMLFGLATDIRKSSFAGKGNKKLLEKVIDEISHGVILFSADKKQCFYANNSAGKIFEFKQNDFIKPDIGKQVFDNLIDKKENEGNSNKGKDKIYTACFSVKGKEKWLEVVEKPFTFYETKCILFITKDVTREKELEDLQSMLLRSFDSFGIAFSVKEADSMKVIFDTSAYKIFGIPIGILLHDTRDYWLNNIVHPEDKPQETIYFKNRSLPKDRKYRILHPQKGLRWIEAKHSFFVSNNKEYMVSFISDITGRENEK